MHIKDSQLFFVGAGHLILVAVLSLFLYSLHGPNESGHDKSKPNQIFSLFSLKLSFLSLGKSITLSCPNVISKYSSAVIECIVYLKGDHIYYFGFKVHYRGATYTVIICPS